MIEQQAMTPEEIVLRLRRERGCITDKEKEVNAMTKKMNAKSVIEDMEINKNLMSEYNFN